jgi:FkbM family methyltransferase
MPNKLLSAAKRTANLILGSFGLELRRTQKFAARSRIQAVVTDRLIPQIDNAVRWPNRPAAFVLVSSNHGTMIINRNDYCLSEQNEAFGIGYAILNTSSANALEVRYLLSLLSNRRRFYGEGVVAVDCGANVGIHTIEYSRHMFGWGTVTAIEAQEMLFYALCGNVVINNCLNARALFAAVGSEVREILVPSLDYFKPASFASLELHQSNSNEFIGQNVEYDETKCKKVQQITIDHLKLQRVDLLKIDVEGMEADVLAGAENTIRSHKPQLHVEWTKSDANSIVETLKRWGYKHYIVGDNIVAIHESDRSGANISVKDGSLHIGGS